MATRVAVSVSVMRVMSKPRVFAAIHRGFSITLPPRGAHALTTPATTLTVSAMAVKNLLQFISFKV
jgi:hypothetical protein